MHQFVTSYVTIHALLEQQYGSRVWRPGRPGLEEFILTILSQSTTDRNSGRAFLMLRNRFVDWQAIADAPIDSVIESIRVAGLAADKAARIQTVLRHPDVVAAGYTIDFLADWPLERAIAWLTGFHGVGNKTAGCVLLFAYGKPMLPVDTHIARVAYRLGLTSRHNPEHAHRVLAEIVPDSHKYAAHMHLIQLGRLVCGAKRPKCTVCPLHSCCPSREVA